jgi:pyrimidine operon attenuation protein/uracil phosphoribosyltransferase
LLSSGEFKNKRVIFVDDVLKQPSQAEKTKDVIIRYGLASKVFFLYAAQLDAEDPVEFERVISHSLYNNDLESLTPLLMEPNSFMVVHRLALAVLDPQNVPRLADFFHKLPEETVVKLYEAATSGDFRSRYNGRYLISTAILQQELHDRGWVDIDGFLFETKSLKPLEAEQAGESHRIVSYYLDSRQDIPFEEAEFYSLMKYGDPQATHHIAEEMAQRLLADEQVLRMINNGEDLIMTSSPSGEVKTAAAHLVDHIETILSQQGIKIRRVKIHRRGNFATQNFGQMTQEQRQKEMKARRIEFDQKDEEFVRGKRVIVVDDLYATGSHEQAAKGLLKKVGAEGIYLYHIQFGETLKVNEPDTEEWLNRAAMVSLYDLFYRLLQLDLATQPPDEN